MDFKEYVKFANDNPTCFMATMDGDQPRVRAITMWFADETGFYFQSQSVKAMCKQLEKNPKLEVCFHTKNFSKVMRIYGEAKFVDDVTLRARCIEERHILKEINVTDPGDPMLAVIHLYTGEAYFWTGADTMKEADITRVRF